MGIKIGRKGSLLSFNDEFDEKTGVGCTKH